MRSTTIFASVLAFAASAFAQTPGYAVISAPGQGAVVPAGKTYAIKWSAGKFTGPASISLLGGSSPGTLAVLSSIAASVDVKDETFSWAVDCSLGDLKTYGIQISDEASKGATFQYSFPFEIKGPSCASASSSTTESSTSSASTTGHPTKGTSYPTLTSTSVTKPTTTSTGYSVSSGYSTTSVKSYPTTASAHTTLATYTTPVVTVTQTYATTGNSSASYPTTSTTTTPTPLPTTNGAARMGAGLALGLMAAALAL
ncbi:Ser-Thr-rich glycosyl-phosphatidyl-inositol-anchored membrane family-domain-containing protein [Nemania sp. NC0429]|nr:Ser-Thr-rich glycosyl-phosphatidyl-inositol-anchored membrane family-domain-containing protein [Nemania sp. NC0429]